MSDETEVDMGELADKLSELAALAGDRAEEFAASRRTARQFLAMAHTFMLAAPALLLVGVLALMDGQLLWGFGNIVLGIWSGREVMTMSSLLPQARQQLAVARELGPLLGKLGPAFASSVEGLVRQPRKKRK